MFKPKAHKGDRDPRLSRNAGGEMLVNAAPGLGAAVAQGEVVPDRYVLDRAGRVKESALRQTYHALSCAHGRRALSRALFGAPCLDAEQLAELALLMGKCEEIVGGPAEIEWAQDDTGIHLLQARPLAVAVAPGAGEIWLKH